MTGRHWRLGIGVLAVLSLAAAAWWDVWQGDGLRFPYRFVAQANLASDYRPGDRVAPLDGVELSAAVSTLVIFVNPSCQYCIDTMDFYRVLSEMAAAAPRNVHLVVVGIEPEPVLDQFLKRYGVSPKRVIAARRSEVKTRVTPTILLVDASGTINRVWTGEPTAATRALIFESIHNVSR